MKPSNWQINSSRTLLWVERQCKLTLESLPTKIKGPAATPGPSCCFLSSLGPILLLGGVRRVDRALPLNFRRLVSSICTWWSYKCPIPKNKYDWPKMSYDVYQMKILCKCACGGRLFLVNYAYNIWSKGYVFRYCLSLAVGVTSINLLIFFILF